jgi:hypothetical protein
MDAADMSFDSTPLRQQFPRMTWQHLHDLINDAGTR